MPRIFHAFAIVLLIGSAVYVYKIKYDTMALTSEVARLNKQIAAEQEKISLLKAEWQGLNRPDRLQKLAESNLDLVPLSTQQIVRWQDVPERAAEGDMIGDKLSTLGLTDTPSKSPKAGDPRPAQAIKP
jgi:cell division protein FtsL